MRPRCTVVRAAVFSCRQTYRGGMSEHPGKPPARWRYLRARVAHVGAFSFQPPVGDAEPCPGGLLPSACRRTSGVNPSSMPCPSALRRCRQAARSHTTWPSRSPRRGRWVAARLGVDSQAQTLRLTQDVARLAAIKMPLPLRFPGLGAVVESWFANRGGRDGQLPHPYRLSPGTTRCRFARPRSRTRSRIWPSASRTRSPSRTR